MKRISTTSLRIFTESLRKKAKEYLNKFDKESRSLFSALLVRDYRSNARIRIEVLENLRRSNKMDEDLIKKALEHAYEEMEGETLKNLVDCDLLILAALVKNQDTNKAYSEVSAFSYLIV